MLYVQRDRNTYTESCCLFFFGIAQQQIMIPVSAMNNTASEANAYSVSRSGFVVVVLSVPFLGVVESGGVEELSGGVEELSGEMHSVSPIAFSSTEHSITSLSCI